MTETMTYTSLDQLPIAVQAEDIAAVLGALVRFGLVFDFFLSLAVKAFVFASTVIMETNHQTQFPCAVWTLPEMAISVRPSFCHAYSFLWHRRFAILL